MGVEELACFYGADKPTDILLCFVSAGGVPIWNIVYLGLMFLLVVGWSMGLRRFDYGMMVGGFLISLIGLPMFALELISIESWMIAIVIMIVGIVITAIRGSSGD